MLCFLFAKVIFLPFAAEYAALLVRIILLSQQNSNHGLS